jgi:hypothetical protein
MDKTLYQRSCWWMKSCVTFFSMDKHSYLHSCQWMESRVTLNLNGWTLTLLASGNVFFIAQANGRACVSFGCTHQIDGLFWSLPIYLLGFFSKYECWVSDLIMPLYHFNFFGLSIAFLYHKVSYYNGNV